MFWTFHPFGIFELELELWVQETRAAHEAFTGVVTENEIFRQTPIALGSRPQIRPSRALLRDESEDRGLTVLGVGMGGGPRWDLALRAGEAREHGEKVRHLGRIVALPEQVTHSEAIGFPFRVASEFEKQEPDAAAQDVAERTHLGEENRAHVETETSKLLL